MDAFERRLRERLQALPRLRFDERSRAEVIRRVRRRRYRHIRNYVKAVGFATAVLGIFFLTTHFQANIEQSIIHRAHEDDLHMPSKTYSNDHAMAFSFAPLKVTNVKVTDVLSDPSQPKSLINSVIGHQIEADITNIGKVALSDMDVQGMLFITKGGTSDFTAQGTWQDFVTMDLGKRPTLYPGETLHWHFKPMGEWYSNALSLDDIHLEFVYRDSAQFSSSVSETPLVWQTPNVDIEKTQSYKNVHGGITVQTVIKNVGIQPVRLSDTFAMISFNNNLTTSLMAPSKGSFFADPSSSAEIKPGAVQTVNFTIIPIPGVDLTAYKPQVALIERQ